MRFKVIECVTKPRAPYPARKKKTPTSSKRKPLETEFVHSTLNIEFNFIMPTDSFDVKIISHGDACPQSATLLAYEILPRPHDGFNSYATRTLSIHTPLASRLPDLSLRYLLSQQSPSNPKVLVNFLLLDKYFGPLQLPYPYYALSLAAAAIQAARSLSASVLW